MTRKTIFLIRHGQSISDVEDRFGGDFDDHLTELGRLQSGELAKRLIDKQITQLFVSPRIRAQQTAQILASVLDIPFSTNEDLRERNAYGKLTGMLKSEAREKYPEDVKKLADYIYAPEGAESYMGFKERIVAAFNIIINDGDSTVGIVTHGGPLRCFFREQLRLGEFEYIGDCAFAELHKEDDQLKVVSLSSAKLINPFEY